MAFSAEYLEQLKTLHNKSSFGSGSDIPEIVKNILDKGQIKSFLDFGSGKGFTSQAIKKQYPDIQLYSYDPVTSPIQLPKEVDMVYSSDVLEHIEPDLLEKTLSELFLIAKKYQYHLIACHPAKKVLSDGRNAHLIIEKPEWWQYKIKKLGWTTEYEKVTERFVERLNINVVKYITVIKNEKSV